MAKKVDNVVLDGAFAVISGGAIREAICSSEPANFAAIAAATLAEATMAPADFVVADGDTSGRKVTMGAKTGVSVTATGTANHVVLHNNVDTMYYVTTCTSQALTSGNTVNAPAWKIEIADPTP